MSEVISVPCNFCNSTEFKEYDREGSWTIVKCSNCGFIYTNPQPSPESLPNYYSEDYFKDKRHKSKFYNEDGTQKNEVANYTNRITDIETHSDERGKILEIGSARGGFLKTMKERGWSVQGVEISADAAAIANQNGVETFVGTFMGYDSEVKADAICMYQTLEHLPNPKEILNKAKTVLNNHGLLIIEVPNIECFEMKYSKERKHLSYDLPRHLNHFSPSFLKKELEKIGFEILEVELYPPKNLIRLLQLISRKKSPAKVESQSTENKPMSPPKLSKKQIGKVGKLIQFSSRLFPGWRFTIIARKKGNGS